MYTLYGAPGSGAASAEIALSVTGVEYRVVRAASWEPDSAIAELERLNPLRQVPTLVLPDGSVLTESAAIQLHLGLEHPASNLLPSSSAARAQAIRGLVFIAANCYSAVGVSDHPERWCVDADESEVTRVREAARAQLHRNWEIFADTFAAKPYLTGAEPGALDYLAATVSRWSGARAHVAEHRPDFLATLKRIEAHPNVAPVFARYFPD